MDIFWPGEADTDYYQTLTINEKQLLTYGGVSPQLEFRSELVSWVSEVSRLYKLCRHTEHLSVTLMDIFMDRFRVGENQLMLLALSCISVAAKCEEQEIMIPRPGHMIPLVNRQIYNEHICLKMELRILQNFDWKVQLPTVAHFVDYLMKDSFLDLPLHNHSRPESSAVCLDHIQYTLDELHGIVLHDVQFRMFLPSLVASAMVFVTRYYHNLQPLWPLNLIGRTGYTQDKLLPSLIGRLTTGLLRAERIRSYTDLPPADRVQSPESGYASSGSVSPSISPPPLVTP